MIARITKSSKHVKVDLTDFTSAGMDLTHSVVYIMKDQASFVGLSNKGDYVEVCVNGIDSLLLDQAGVKGIPCTIEGVTPSTNAELAEELAKLKEL